MGTTAAPRHDVPGRTVPAARRAPWVEPFSRGDDGGRAGSPIDVQQAARLSEAGVVLLLDVREDGKWAAGRAPGAVHLPLGRRRAADLPVDKPALALCRSGRAAAPLAAVVVDVRNMTGGMTAWAAAGLPVVAAGERQGTVA